METVKTTYFKAGALALIMLFGVSANGQTKEEDSGGDNTKQTSAAGKVIKLIDNKGTIKYLQSNNGITTITSTAPDNKTTTTWQLGGTLVDATTITIPDSGNFTIDGEEFYLKNTQAQFNNTAAETYDSGSGYTLLTRDETTGQVEKMLATDLVKGIRVVHNQTQDATESFNITVDGLPTLTAGTTYAKLFVYRNGIKLRNTDDFTAAENIITIKHHETNLPMYSGDIIEIQYIK